MLVKFGPFYHGRVIFAARGDQLARFVNEGIRDGVVFYKTQKSERGLKAQVSIEDFKKLRHAARHTHTRIHILAKYGWPFIALRWWRRKTLMAGIFIIGMSLIALSQMVLSIQVTGVKMIPEEQLLQSAEMHGLKTWVWQKDVNTREIVKALVEEFPDAAWIGIEHQGTRININVKEKIRPVVQTERGNLVANKTGIIHELMVIQGTPLVHEGETVKAGQVLIEAPVSLDNPTAQPKPGIASKPNPTLPQAIPAAKGFARARVWYTSEATVPLSEDKIEESGRSAKGWGIKFGNRVIMVTTPESPFDQVTKEVKIHAYTFGRNWHFPVEILSITYKELETVHFERIKEEAQQIAEKQAKDEILSKISPGASIIEERVRVLATSDGMERVRVETETYEDLAVYPNP
ncbi:sporulation protein YqfD [Desulfitobacterium metallireducens]|uniref:Sporulation protein YqfD n=1 Tax=Desulfitobacterium metallireducens DSM 15288 TaxID=871968 RepID=W0EAS0_9FIRM|nr:sporulation protein YqfD [Desulfitobacterium metallireducens]AHF07852.1 sporulation protein YqfD [Desulfitobacterium metallireducens DSM 15288]